MDCYIVDRMGGGVAEDDNPSMQRMQYHLDSLDTPDVEHVCVRLVDRKTRWGIEIYSGGLAVLQNTNIAGSARHQNGVTIVHALEMWKSLANGEIDNLLALDWLPGYG